MPRKVLIAYQMSVTNLQGLIDAIANLSRGGLPGAVSQLTVGSDLSAMFMNWRQGAMAHWTYGILWPVLRVTVFPDDILMVIRG